jgi:hypothetical protein
MNPDPNVSRAQVFWLCTSSTLAGGRMYQPLRIPGRRWILRWLRFQRMQWTSTSDFQPPRHGIDLSVFNDPFFRRLVIRCWYQWAENVISPFLYFKANIEELSTKTVLHFSVTRWHKHRLGNTNKSVALILGSSMLGHFAADNIQVHTFTDHLG